MRFFAAIILTLATVAGGVHAEQADDVDRERVRYQSAGRFTFVPNDPAKRCRKFEPLIEAAGLRPVFAWSFIAWRESKCVTRAVGWNYHAGKSHVDCASGKFDAHRRCSAVRSFDVGLFQINSTWVTVTANTCGTKRGDLTALFTPACNVAVARYLADNGGFGHWGFRTSERVVKGT